MNQEESRKHGRENKREGGGVIIREQGGGGKCESENKRERETEGESNIKRVGRRWEV